MLKWYDCLHQVMESLVQEKGQVTLPRQAREELGIKPGDAIVWIRNDQGHWEVWTLDQLTADLGFGSGEIREWSKRAKKGYNPKGTER